MFMELFSLLRATDLTTLKSDTINTGMEISAWVIPPSVKFGD